MTCSFECKSFTESIVEMEYVHALNVSDEWKRRRNKNWGLLFPSCLLNIRPHVIFNKLLLRDYFILWCCLWRAHKIPCSSVMAHEIKYALIQPLAEQNRMHFCLFIFGINDVASTGFTPQR